jgi:ADP-ribose pyrophosphatase YjhB (NUDIX family)
MEIVKRYSGVLVKVGDEVLMCKRNSKGSLPGVWSIPAGSIEGDETPLDGAKREFFEETDKKIEGKLKLIGFVNRYGRDGSKYRGLMYVFLYETDDKIIPSLETAKDGEEHTECGYFTLENVPFEDKNDQLYKLIHSILKKD